MIEPDVFVCPQALMKSLQDLSEFSSEPDGLVIFVLKQKRSKKFKAVIQMLKFKKFR